jgi:hypothetical protein
VVLSLLLGLGGTSGASSELGPSALLSLPAPIMLRYAGVAVRRAWVAERYDVLWPELFHPTVVEQTVEFLARWAGPGPALEFGIGTGRIAVPLSGHLQPGGHFVIENYVPELQRLPLGETRLVFTATPTHLGFEEYDVAKQIAVSHHNWVIDDRLERFSSPHRYVWPAELDLMARIAGLTLRQRWASWTREPFTSESRSHISVWEKAPVDP